MTDKEYNYKNSHIASKVKFKLNTIKYNGIYTIHFNITDLIISHYIISNGIWQASQTTSISCTSLLYSTSTKTHCYSTPRKQHIDYVYIYTSV